MHWVYCPNCGNELGQVFAGRVAMKHRGREWVGPLPDVVRCEECRQNVEGEDLATVRPTRPPLAGPAARAALRGALLRRPGAAPDPPPPRGRRPAAV